MVTMSSGLIFAVKAISVCAVYFSTYGMKLPENGDRLAINNYKRALV